MCGNCGKNQASSNDGTPSTKSVDVTAHPQSPTTGNRSAPIPSTHHLTAAIGFWNTYPVGLANVKLTHQHGDDGELESYEWDVISSNGKTTPDMTALYQIGRSFSSLGHRTVVNWLVLRCPKARLLVALIAVGGCQWTWIAVFGDEKEVHHEYR